MKFGFVVAVGFLNNTLAMSGERKKKQTKNTYVWVLL